MGSVAQTMRMLEICLLEWRSKTSTELAKAFGTEERCVEWMRRAKWPTGFSCPKCGGWGDWIDARRGYLCGRCRKFCSVTAGTILHGARKPLRKWFEALFLIVQRGVNARTLQRQIGLTYKVAWTWGHKLRGLLAELKVTDELRPPREKKQVAYEAERRARAPRVEAPRADVEGPCGCTKLLARDWKTWEWEEWPDKKARTIIEDLNLPRFPALDEPRSGDIFAHWDLLGSYFGSLSEKHLRGYLDELTFRMNRQWRDAEESFFEVTPAVVSAEPRPYKAIVAKAPAEGYPMAIYDRLPRRLKRTVVEAAAREARGTRLDSTTP